MEQVRTSAWGSSVLNMPHRQQPASTHLSIITSDDGHAPTAFRTSHSVASDPFELDIEESAVEDLESEAPTRRSGSRAGLVISLSSHSSSHDTSAPRIAPITWTTPITPPLLSLPFQRPSLDLTRPSLHSYTLTSKPSSARWTPSIRSLLPSLPSRQLASYSVSSISSVDSVASMNPLRTPVSAPHRSPSSKPSSHRSATSLAQRERAQTTKRRWAIALAVLVLLAGALCAVGVMLSIRE